MSERISRDNMLMEVAYAVSRRGTCNRLQVGVVVSREGRIITTGYNGAPRGLPHCHHFPGENLPAGCANAEHAERNAIAFAARYGLSLDCSEMHVTHMPCLNCARVVINAGIQRVTYQVPYRRTDGVELLTKADVEVVEYHGDPVR